METILITITKVRELYDIDYNLNSDQFNQFALRVQRNSLKSLLGDNLYDDVTDASPSIDYSALLDPYIYNYLSAAFIAKFVVEGSMFHTNRGNYQFDNNTTKEPDRWQLQQISGNYKQEQNDYRNDIITFLEENKATYALWESDQEESTGFSFAIV